MGKNLKNDEASKRPAANEEFRRKQSSLYKNMNPQQVGLEFMFFNPSNMSPVNNGQCSQGK